MREVGDQTNLEEDMRKTQSSKMDAVPEPAKQVSVSYNTKNNSVSQKNVDI